jgi:hypothetical protein
MRKLFVTFAAVVALGACGGGSEPPGGPSTPPPPPSAVITAAGDGTLVIHPSLQGFNYALEAPITIQEMAGGSADWTSARFTARRNGQEIARREITADVLAGAGFTRIAPNQDEAYVLVFHLNTVDFDAWTVTLRFVDRATGSALTVDIPATTWDDVEVDLEPLSRPEPGYRLE